MVTTRPRIAYPPDTALGELRTAELLVVSCLRLWVHAYRGCTCGYPDWSEGLERGGISAAGATGFDTLWRVVATTALRTLDIRPVYCMHLGEDEGRFLSLIGLLQHGRALDAEPILGDWCPASAVRLALAPARSFAIALAACRLWLPGDRIEEAPPVSHHMPVRSVDAPRIH